MTTHTKGPWKVGQYLGSLRQFVIHMDVGGNGRGSDVAFTSAAFGNDETIANARLIAAAPDLLEALKDMVDLVELMCPFDGPQQRKARAAIARATGESE